MNGRQKFMSIPKKCKITSDINTSKCANAEIGNFWANLKKV